MAGIELYRIEVLPECCRVTGIVPTERQMQLMIAHENFMPRYFECQNIQAFKEYETTAEIAKKHVPHAEDISFFKNRLKKRYGTLNSQYRLED